MSNDPVNPTTDLQLARVQSQAPIAVPSTEYDGVRFMMSPAESLRRLEELRAFVKTVMRPGINGDYAIIPGTQKATLLQPGAQKLCEIYGLAVSFEDVETVKDWDKPFFFYRKRCVLTSRRDGRFICDGIGSCNSKEDRYAGRWVNESDVPAGLNKDGLKRKEKQTQRGAWVQYRVPNDDICSLVNTIEKMACKRALVHATLNATRSADIFSQDLEHVDADAVGEAEETRSWEKPEENIAAKVEAFKQRILAADTDPEFNAVAADLAKSDLPMSEGAPLRKLWSECKAAKTAAKAKPPESPAAPAPAAVPPETTKAASGKGKKPEPKRGPSPAAGIYDEPVRCDRAHQGDPCADPACWLTSDPEPAREPGQEG